MRRLLALFAVFCSLAASQQARDSARIERLAAAGKVWAFVKFFHPYLAYRPIDWDAVWEKAAPAIGEAEDPGRLEAR